MMARLPAALLAVIGGLVLTAPPAAAPALAQAQRDWSRVIVMTPEGGFRMGNPQAPVKLVEYFSLTCSHCADFAATGAPRLIDAYVRSGRVSFEYRNFVLNGLDLAAAFVSRCAAPENYFALNHAILASQQQWMGRITAMPAEQRRAMEGLAPLETMRRVVEIAGLDDIAARHGVDAARARACLADQAGLERIVEMQRAGSSFGVQGTPSFAINGRLAGSVHDWASLEPLLRTAR
ncbi:MAG: thioredoxin domain-containing protein [Sphingomonas sp.]|nr:thioredoxin domain-containing protein [Sphingomonas sp.]